MGTRIRSASIALVLFLKMGCAPIRSQTTIADMPIAPTLRGEVIADSTQYTVRANVEGEQIFLSVDQSETCVATSTPRVRRTRSVVRTADSRVVTTTWAIAALGLAGGIYSYSNADALAASDQNSGQSPGDYRTYGVGMAILGLGAAVVGIVDAVRASDSQYDNGIIPGAPNRTESACRRHPTRDENVVLELRDGEVAKGRINGDGSVALSLLSTPEAGIPDATTEVAVIVGRDRIPVDLPAAQRDQLRRELIADPHSRLSLDRIARHRDECTQAVAAARGLTPPEPDEPADELRSTWSMAKSSCADLWTPELDGELSVIEQRINAAHCTQRLVRVAEALTGDAAEFALEDAATELTDLRSTCSSEAQVAQINQLEARRTTVAKRVAKAHADEARRLAQQQAQEARAAQRRRSEAASRQQSWGSAMLLCNDGTLSPSCTCGRGSYRGCCSWHGGVNRCSAGDGE